MFHSMTSVSAWLAGGIALLIIIAFGAWIPITSDFIQLDGRTAILCLLPLLISAFAVAIRFQSRHPIPAVAWYLVALNSFLLQFFLAALIMLASDRAAPAFAMLLLLTAAIHGFNHRFTFTEPLGTVGTLVVCLLATALFARNGAGLGLMAITAPAAALVTAGLGRFALTQELERRERDRLREAIRAQMLNEQSQQIAQLSDSLVDLLGRNHDLRNISLSVSTNAQVLAALTRSAPEGLPEDLKETVDDLEQGVNRLVELLQAAMAQSARSRAVLVPESHDVAFLPLIDEVLEQIAPRYPAVKTRVDANRNADLRGLVTGGTESVFRILQNLLINACEGDGSASATEVTVRCWIHSSGTILNLEVIDNGPGFGADQLDRPAEVFRSTKSTGTGLGLYIVERTVLASGGRISLSNAPGGGAVVRLEFPRRT